MLPLNASPVNKQKTSKNHPFPSAFLYFHPVMDDSSNFYPSCSSWVVISQIPIPSSPCTSSWSLNIIDHIHNNIDLFIDNMIKNGWYSNHNEPLTIIHEQFIYWYEWYHWYYWLFKLFLHESCLSWVYIICIVSFPSPSPSSSHHPMFIQKVCVVYSIMIW